MKYVNWKDIDPIKWDGFIATFPKVHFYFLHGYLSSICQWDAIIQTDELGNYAMVLPLPFKHKLFWRFLYRPFFCQQLGILSHTPLATQQLSRIEKLLDQKFSFGVSAWKMDGYAWKTLKSQTCVNLVLDLNKPYSDLKLLFNKNRRRQLGKLAKLEIDTTFGDRLTDLESIISKVRETLGAKVSEVKDIHFENLVVAMDQIKTQVEYTVVSALVDQKVVGAGVYVQYNGRCVYILGYSLPEVEKLGVSTQIMNEMIQKKSEQHVLLDFEGSSVEGVARFYKSFGAIEENYQVKSLNPSHFVFKKIFR